MVEQLLFSINPSILTFDSDLILGPLFYFWGLIGYIWGLGRVQKLFFLSSHVVEHLLFSTVPSILTFYFDLILGQFNFLGS